MTWARAGCLVLVIDQVGSTNFLVTHGEPAAARVTSEHGDAVANIVDTLIDPMDRVVGVMSAAPAGTGLSRRQGVG